MLREKRHAFILSQLKLEHFITIQDLSQALDVSYMTIWRDLEKLEQQRQIQRIRGGAILPRSEAPTSPPKLDYAPLPFDENFDKKSQIARYVAQELIDPGDTIIIEAGSTASSIAPYLDKSNLTVLTNGLKTSMMLFHKVHQINVLCSGGVLIDTGAFTGPQAEDFFTNYRVKKAFFSAQGVSLEDGFTDPSPLYVRLKCVMHQHTEKVIMVLDSTKLGVRSLVPVMKLDEVDILVTDSEAPPDLVQALRDRNLEVRIVPPSTDSLD